MKFEFSAGGIVYRREKTRKEDNSQKNAKIYILVSQHSQHLGWVFPKGLIGDHVKGENKESTALREVEEETGAEAIIEKQIAPVTYWYVLEGEKRKKTVYYFIMKYTGGDIAKHDHEMTDVQWIESSKVLDKLTYKGDKDAFREALPTIKELAKS